VRLPRANETLERNPPAADYAVKANPKLRGKHAPVRLKISNRMVYFPHAYAPAGHTFQSYDELKQVYDARAGYLLRAEPGVPLWVGEFGTCRTLECEDQGQCFRWFVRHLRENELSWSYWPLNGTQSNGNTREDDDVEMYGLLTPDYHHIAPEIVRLLQTIESSERAHQR
jgi:endoglucanase